MNTKDCTKNKNWILAQEKNINTWKLKKIELIKIYQFNPRLCEYCKLPLQYENRHNKFCNTVCRFLKYSSGQRWSQETKNKMSLALKGRISPLKGRIKKVKEIKYCPICKKEFSCKTKIFCSPACSIYDQKHGHKFTPLGGFRKNGGRGKHGNYKGYWCQSTYELAYVVYNLDHNIHFIRNTKSFPYIYKNENHLYFPDFKEDNSYIEIKGYLQEVDSYKFDQFPKNETLKVIGDGGEDISKYLKYAIEKYGKQFWLKLYE